MKILVTGATGFVGQYVITELLAHDHDVVAVARNLRRAMEMPWYDQVRFITCDLHDPALDPVATLGVPDAMIHLAWPGLPRYKELFHFEQNLPMDYRFIKNMVSGGLRQVLVTGTCFEYGMQYGALTANTPTSPNTPYGLAKDTLRRFLQELQVKQPFILQWVRLFYLYGSGQNPNSLLAQLDREIDAGSETFKMSGGEQLRDYLPVTQAARYLAILVEQSNHVGIINCCSGKPVSVRGLVERRIAERGASIRLNLGHYPYPDYEPMAFWGSAQQFDQFFHEQG